MSQDVHISSVVLPQTAANDMLITVLRAPTDANGGGLTIVSAEACDEAITGQGTGTAMALQLLKYSNAGTPALAGTIGTNSSGGSAIGGTADNFAAGVPKAFVIDEDSAFVDAGQYVKIKYLEIGAATNPVQCSVTVAYKMGRTH